MPQGATLRRRSSDSAPLSPPMPMPAIPALALDAFGDDDGLVCSFTIACDVAEPYDPEFEQWLSEQEPLDSVLAQHSH